MTEQSIHQAPPLSPRSVDSEPPPRDDEFTGVWTFVWILVGVKLAMLIAIVWFAARSKADLSLLAAMHWYFLLIPIGAIAGPLLFQARLRRVRRKRAQLQASEWMVDELRNTR
jgi:hypothetical protein